MAKILYGIAGEGMGHLMRSKPILKHLLEEHEIVIVSSRKPYKLLSQEFKNVHEIHGLHISYRNNEAKHFMTFLENLINFPGGALYSFKKLLKIVRSFKPDIIISDFEPFTPVIARIFRIPVISIDNMHIVTNCKNKIPLRYYKDYIVTKLLVKSFVSKGDYFLINTFFYPKIKKKNTYLFPPILREDIIGVKPKKNNHILVYQTTGTNKKLKEILKKIDYKFIIYGFNISKKEKNMIFRKFNEKTFIKDLSSSSAVITNGGFTTISEALSLGKPILSEPIKKHFEQIITAMNIDKLGYGEYQEDLTEQTLRRFISNIPKYRINLKGYKRGDNKALLKKLDSIIKRIKP